MFERLYIFPNRSTLMLHLSKYSLNCQNHNEKFFYLIVKLTGHNCERIPAAYGKPLVTSAVCRNFKCLKFRHKTYSLRLSTGAK